MPNTTKRDLVIELSNRTGQPQAHVAEWLEVTLDLIGEELSNGHDVTLRRFGTFEVRVSKPKIGRNPKISGSEVQIPARSVVKFKPGMELKQRVGAALPKLKPSS